MTDYSGVLRSILYRNQRSSQMTSEISMLQTLSPSPQEVHRAQNLRPASQQDTVTSIFWWQSDLADMTLHSLSHCFAFKVSFLNLTLSFYLLICDIALQDPRALHLRGYLEIWSRLDIHLCSYKRFSCPRCLALNPQALLHLSIQQESLSCILWYLPSLHSCKAWLMPEACMPSWASSYIYEIDWVEVGLSLLHRASQFKLQA